MTKNHGGKSDSRPSQQKKFAITSTKNGKKYHNHIHAQNENKAQKHYLNKFSGHEIVKVELEKSQGPEM